MNNKILNNPVFTLTLLVLLAVGSFLAWRFFTQAGGDEIIINSSNPNYIKIVNDIDNMSHKKWNRLSYGITRENIGNYVSNKLISNEEADGLTTLLDTKYLTVLSDTVIQFCKTGNNLNHLNELNDAVKAFQNPKFDNLTTSIKEYLNSYYGALNVCGTIHRYANGRYSLSRYNALQSNLKDYNTKIYISENTFIQEKLTAALFELKEHATLESDFEEKVLNEKVSCERQYGKYEYYKLMCDCWQSSADTIPNFKENCDSQLKDKE